MHRARQIFDLRRELSNLTFQEIIILLDHQPPTWHTTDFSQELTTISLKVRMLELKNSVLIVSGGGGGLVRGTNFLEAIEVELANKGREVVVFEVLRDQLLGQLFGIEDKEGSALLVP